MSNNIPVLNGFANTIDWDQNQSDLSDLTLGMRRVMEVPQTRTSGVGPILGVDQKERGPWGQEWFSYITTHNTTSIYSLAYLRKYMFFFQILTYITRNWVNLLTSLTCVTALWKMTYSSPLSSGLLTRPSFILSSPTVNSQDFSYTGTFWISAVM